MVAETAEGAQAQRATLPITHGRVLRIAVPIVLSNVTVPILSAVDTGVVGQLGEAAAIGAVGVGAVILSTLYWVFGFLRMGTTGLVSQARGAGDQRESSALLLRGVLLAALAGAALIVTQLALFHLAFALAPASAEVEALARSYLQIRIWGAPATIALYAVTGWLIAMERTRAVFLLQVWMNGLNIVLDLWFVLGLGWGVGGVAFATLLAEWSGLALGLWMCRDGLGRWRGRDWGAVFDRQRLQRMMQVNGDIMVRSVLLTLSFTSFMFVGAGFGDDVLASNQVLMQFLAISSFALDGFAFSAETLVGTALGARNPSALRRAAVVSGQWAVGGALTLALGFWAFGGLIIDAMTTAETVRETARIYLPWAILAPLLSVGSYMVDGVFIGATWTREMRNAMIQSVVVFALVLVVAVPIWGNNGLWLAIMVLNVLRALTLGWRYPQLERRI